MAGELEARAAGEDGEGRSALERMGKGALPQGGDCTLSSPKASGR